MFAMNRLCGWALCYVLACGGAVDDGVSNDAAAALPVGSNAGAAGSGAPSNLPGAAPTNPGAMPIPGNAPGLGSAPSSGSTPSSVGVGEPASCSDAACIGAITVAQTCMAERQGLCVSLGEPNESRPEPVRPINGVCPAGTEPDYGDCTDVPFCFCKYSCTPACDARHECQREASGTTNSCQCHPALTSSESACSWPGLLDNGGFDDCGGWSLIASCDQREAPIADIDAGRLVLRVPLRCMGAVATASARLPPRDEFPGGAALVFDYMASAAPASESLAEGAIVSLERAFAVLLAVSEPTTVRLCVELGDTPLVTPLRFRMQIDGLCAERVDHELWVDNVRLEAEPGCGRS